MESFFGRYKNALVLMLVLLAQVVLLAMQVRRSAPDLLDGHNVRLWRYLVTGVITPPERLAHTIGLTARGLWANYIDLRHLREQNLGLQQENDRLRLEQASLAEDARQGQRLRELLDFRGRYIDKTLAAQVIGTSGTDQARVIYIDKGSNDGLRVQMPVITPDGVVGKLKNVFPGTSQVLLISDQTSGTGVVLETTRVRGVMKGNASGQPQMINISPDERIKPGEPVITSGGDQVYPPGLPVGVVDRVVPDPETSYVNVVIKPNADLARLEEVLVITEVSDKMPFAQQKDLMQSEVDALAEKQRAADILSEKLPSLHEPGVSAGADDDVGAASGEGDPARPVRPPQPIHPDRYSPGEVPAAEGLTPGAAPPVTHRAAAVEGGSAPAAAPKLASDGTVSASAGRDFVPLNRFPPKPGAASTAAGASAAPASTGPGAAVPKPVARAEDGVASGAGGLSRPSEPGAASVPKPTRTTANSAAGAGEVPPARKAAPSLDGSNGGILAPIGMAPVVATPRPRPPLATSANGTGATASATGATKPTPTKPTSNTATVTKATSTAPPLTKPTSAKPTAAGSSANPTNAPRTTAPPAVPAAKAKPPQPATTPPGGV
jgi:rod shape-determining protein MreC